MPTLANVYERAFDAWLRESNIPCHVMDQTRRREFCCDKIKSFDFAICPIGGKLTLLDIKGRRFDGQTLVGLKGLQCWVTQEDIHGLEEWRDVVASKQPADAAFVFAYHLTQVDVETDGLVPFEFEGQKYVFLIVLLNDYQRRMKQRSPRWQTVYLPAACFRRVATPIEDWIEKLKESIDE